MARDLDQERAAQAWKDAQKGKDSNYKNAAKSAPSMIMNNGLMQTLAFLYQKDESQKELSNQISRQIMKEVFAEKGDPKDRNCFLTLMNKLNDKKTDSIRYRRATESALSYLRWVRQFATALIRD